MDAKPRPGQIGDGKGPGEERANKHHNDGVSVIVLMRASPEECPRTDDQAKSLMYGDEDWHQQIRLETGAKLDRASIFRCGCTSE